MFVNYLSVVIADPQNICSLVKVSQTVGSSDDEELANNRRTAPVDGIDSAATLHPQSNLPRMGSVLRTGSGNVISMKVFDWQRRDAFEKFMPADGKMIIW